MTREPYSSRWNYEVALYFGDDIVDTGTVKAIAERRGVLKRTILYYLSPAAQRRADTRKKQSQATRVVRI